MDTIEVPEVCALAIGSLPVVGRPIWRLTEGKHIVVKNNLAASPNHTKEEKNQQEEICYHRRRRRPCQDGGIQDGKGILSTQSKHEGVSSTYERGFVHHVKIIDWGWVSGGVLSWVPLCCVYFNV